MAGAAYPPNHYDLLHPAPVNLLGRSIDRGLLQDAGRHSFPGDSRQPLPKLYMDPPLSSGQAPIIFATEADG